MLVLHEYCDYSEPAPGAAGRRSTRTSWAWSIEAWRATGGEPDIALALPSWLHELGFEIRAVRPIVEVVPPSSFLWQWPRAFIEVGLKRFVDLDRLSAERAREIWESFCAREARPETLMVTPAVLEIIASRAR